MKTITQILRAIEQSVDTRQAIMDVLASESDLLDVQTAAHIFQTYREHADLVSLLPSEIRQETIELDLKFFAGPVLESLLSNGLLSNPSVGLVKAVINRAKHKEKVIATILSRWFSDGLNASILPALTSNHEAVVELLLRLPAPQAKASLGSYLDKITEPQMKAVLAKQIEDFFANEQISELPAGLLKHLSDSFEKCEALISLGEEVEAQKTFDRIISSPDQSVIIEMKNLQTILSLSSKLMAKKLLKAGHILDTTGGILKLCFFSVYGVEVISKKDLLAALAANGSNLEERMALAQNLGLNIIKIDRTELALVALAEGNIELIVSILSVDRIDKRSAEIRTRVAKLISTNPRQALETALFHDENYSIIVNEAVIHTLNKADTSLLILRYKYMTPETKALIAKSLPKLLGRKDETDGLIAFVEQNEDLLGADELSEIRKNALSSLQSATELLKFSANLEFRKKAISKIKRSSKQSLDALKDTEIELNAGEVLQLISTSERTSLSLLSAILVRHERGEFELDSLPESWRELLEKLQLQQSLSAVHLDKKFAAALIARISVSSIEEVLGQEKELLSDIVAGKEKVLEAPLRRRALLFNIVLKSLGLTALQKCFEPKEVLSYLRSSRSLSCEIVIAALGTSVPLTEEELINKLVVGQVNNLDQLFYALKSEGRTLLVHKIIDAYNKNQNEQNVENIIFVIEHAFVDFRKKIGTIRSIRSNEMIESIYSKEGGRDVLLTLIPALPSSKQAEILGRLMNEKAYSTELVRTALEISQNSTVPTMFTELKWNVVKRIFDDINLLQEEKDQVLAGLSADTVQKMVRIYGPALEKRALSKAFAWPTQAITLSQLEVLNNLGTDEMGLKVRRLFLESLTASEITLTESALNAIRDEDLYLDMIDAIEGLMATKAYVTEEIIDVLLSAARNPKPKSLPVYVAHLGRDWTKLSKEDQLLAITYAVENALDKFQVERSATDGQITLRFASQIVGFAQEDSLYMVHSLHDIDSQQKDILEKIINIDSRLPDVILGSYHVATEEFFSDDVTVPVDDLDLNIDISEATLESLKQISGNVVIRGIKAVRRGSIVYDITLDQQDILEMLSQAPDVLKEAKQIYNQIKRLKKNTMSLLEVMGSIDSGEDRKFGIELEIASSISREQLAKKIGPNVGSQEEYTSDMSWPKWTVKYDCSVKGQNFEAELVSPILQGKDGIKELHSVMAKLEKLAKQDGIVLEVGEKTQTGLHVHHSIEDVIKKFGEIEEASAVSQAMATYLMSVQGALYALCAKWRLVNTFSRPLKTVQELSNEGVDRHGFAITAYGTLEFRLKEATFNVSAMVRWVVLTQQITISMIQRINNEMKESKQKLSEALDFGVDMIFEQRLDEAGQLKEDVISHLAYYQAARNFAMAAA